MVLFGLRFLSFSVLLFSYTPLSSLWFLFLTGGRTSNPRDCLPEGYDPSDQAKWGLGHSLQHPNATMYQVYAAMMLESSRTRFGGSAMAQHYAVAIPWALSLLVGFVMPIVLYAMLLMRSRRVRQLANRWSHCRMTRRWDKIVSLLCHQTMALKEEDYDNSTGTTLWQIPRAGSNDNNNATRWVPGDCAVCLCDYNVGHKVVWSQTQCPHVFHLDCLANWFSCQRKNHFPCPCCRQVFLIRR